MVETENIVLIQLWNSFLKVILLPVPRKKENHQMTLGLNNIILYKRKKKYVQNNIPLNTEERN